MEDGLLNFGADEHNIITTNKKALINGEATENGRQPATFLSTSQTRGISSVANVKSSLPVAAGSGSPCKGLPNIQPKCSERQLIPKNEAPGAGIHSGTQPSKILIPQGIQHVLINGQLYPIIQTANGTHFLIQQPVGQVQNTGEQIFTAQPIQLGGVQQLTGPPPQMSTQSSQYVPPVHQTQTNTLNSSLMSTLQPTAGTDNQPYFAGNAKVNETPSSTVSSSVGVPPPVLPISSSGIAPVLPISSSGIAPVLPIPSSGIAPPLPISSSQQVPSSFNNQSVSNSLGTVQGQAGTPLSSTNLLNTSSTPATVSSQTQQLLSKIQMQIDSFKRNPSLDENAQKTLIQLQQAQQHILNSVRNQLQMHNSNRTGPKHRAPRMSGVAPPTVPQPGQPPLSALMQHSQLLQQGVAQTSANNTELIIKPVADGASPLTQENVMAVINAFANVKVGTQTYNIQLMEGQKKSFVESMSKMNAEQQHGFVTQQQTEILQTVFRNQQQLQQRAHQSNQQPLPPQHQMLPQFSQQMPMQQPISSQPAPKPGPKARSKRRIANKNKADSSVAVVKPVIQMPVPPIIPNPLIDFASSISNKPKPTPKRPKYPANMSIKRISERMLQQIMKDQELILKAGAHKRPFTHKNSINDRLLRFHLFYTAEPYKAYRKLQEEQLYKTTAHETVLSKEKLMDRFLPNLWKDSINPSVAGEDRLIADLLLQDEREALEVDKQLELDDIDSFKALYAQPVRDPTPSPQASPCPSPVDAMCNTEVVLETLPEPSAVISDPVPEIEHRGGKQQLKKSVKSKTLSPESDIIKHLKRETAREARERRAANRGIPSVNDIAIRRPSPVTTSKRGRRGRPPRVRPHDIDTKSVHEHQVNLPSTPRDEVEANEHHQQQAPDNEQQSNMDTGDQSQAMGEEYNNMLSRTSSALSEAQPTGRTTSDERSVGSTNQTMSGDDPSDSEDELIDIGSPLTPPATFTQPDIPTIPVATPNLEDTDMPSPDFTSPPLHIQGYTSSPKKGFSICSETVFEHSEHPDNSYGRQSSSSERNMHNSVARDTHITAESDVAIQPTHPSASAYDTQYSSDGSHPPAINYETQYSEDNSNPPVIEYQSAYPMEHSHPPAINYQTQYSEDANTVNMKDNNGDEKHSNHLDCLPNDVYTESKEPMEINAEDQVTSQMSDGEEDIVQEEEESDYENSTDDGCGDDVGGVAVSWEDTGDNAPSEEEEPSDNSEQLETNDNDIPEDERAEPIMPLRINKNKLGDYAWASDDSITASPPPIRLRINEPHPPPIKLRIKRDGNDKWEAASSVSSYTTEQQSSSGEACSEQDEISENGDVNSNSNSSVSEDDLQQHVEGRYQQGVGVEEDMPFTHYSTYQDDD